MLNFFFSYIETWFHLQSEFYKLSVVCKQMLGKYVVLGSLCTWGIKSYFRHCFLKYNFAQLFKIMFLYRLMYLAGLASTNLTDDIPLCYINKYYISFVNISTTGCPLSKLPFFYVNIFQKCQNWEIILREVLYRTCLYNLRWFILFIEQTT